MRDTNKKIFFLLLIICVIFMGLKPGNAYATTDAEELKSLLDEYENDLGDLNQLKVVVDETYNDLYTATKVDDALKEKLYADIDKLDNVEGMTTLIKTVLDVELKSQISNLTDENIDEMREEISVIKEWVDAKVGATGNGGGTGGNGDTGNTGSTGDAVNGTDNGGTGTIDTQEKGTAKPTQTTSTDTKTKNNVSTQNLPKTGTISVIGKALIVLVICAIISIIRYRKLKEIK